MTNKRKLTIEITFEEGKPLTNQHLIVSLDGLPLALLQRLYLKADAQKVLTDLEIVFPEQHLDWNYKAGFGDTIEHQTKELLKIPGIKVSTLPHFPAVEDVVTVHEIGTDGPIDNFKVNKKNE